MRKRVLLGLAAVALAGCESPVPNSAAGVGFGDYQTYLRQHEADQKGQAVAAAPAAPVASASLTPAPGGGYGANGYGATPVTSPAGQMAAASAAPPVPGSIGAEALAALRATAPAATPAASSATAANVGAPLDPMAMTAALPTAPAPVASQSTGPNLAAYALAATNAPGQAVYTRGGLKLASSERACARFVSPDLAQMDFLRRGGPERDPGNLDPDGDGFACGWDPRPFQTARQ